MMEVGGHGSRRLMRRHSQTKRSKTYNWKRLMVFLLSRRPASVFEVANWFLLLRIDTDDGQALVDKSFSLRPDVKELLMAIGFFGRGHLFAVYAEFEFQFLEQAAHGVLAHRDSPSGALFSDLARRSPAPLHPREGVSGSVVPHQFFDLGDDFGCFFPAACARRRLCGCGLFPGLVPAVRAAPGPPCEGPCQIGRAHV